MSEADITNSRYFVHAQLDALMSPEWRTKARDLDWLRAKAREYVVFDMRRAGGLNGHAESVQGVPK